MYSLVMGYLFKKIDDIHRCKLNGHWFNDLVLNSIDQKHLFVQVDYS